MNVTIKNSKSVGVYSGVAWSCDLYLDGVKAAHVSNRGDGGMTRFDWYKNELQTPFQQYVKTTSHEDEESLVCHLCDKLDEQKRLKRLCKNKTVVKMKKNKDGEYSIWNTPFSPQVKDKLKQVHGDQIIEFVNETIQ